MQFSTTKLLLLLALFVVAIRGEFDAAYDEADVGAFASPFDYIVVGGGGTGAVIAARLSDDSSNSVLLLEGGARSQASVGGKDYVASRWHFDSNGKAVFEQPLTRFDVPLFCRTTVPNVPGSPVPGYPLNTSWAGIQNVHSRILGGNSVHNSMLWGRITKLSFESWNLNGWTYADVLPFFKKTENVSASPTLNGDYVYHGHNGPIQITNVQALDKVGIAFWESCIANGYGNKTDYNLPNPTGCSLPVFNIDTEGIRSSSVHAYLAPALPRPNLRMRVNALVTKVLFNNATPKKAIGVQYKKNGNTYTAYANKEIILSAGAFNSPKILMLSGIGPSAHLTSLGIPVIKNLPVGTRMGLHPTAPIRYRYAADVANPFGLAFAAIEYARFGTGLWATIGHMATAFLKSDNSLPEADINTIVMLGSGVAAGQVEFNTQLVKPQQMNGVLTLQSANPDDPPFLNFTKWQNEDDVAALVSGIKIGRKIAKTYPANETLGAELLPGPTVVTNSQLRDYVRSGNPGITHLWGGAVMGNAGDNTAVLDWRARVKGVNGLRVADLSIVPGVHGGGGPIANVIMFGERISHFILQDN